MEILLALMSLAAGLPILNPFTSAPNSYPAFILMATAFSIRSEAIWGAAISLAGALQLFVACSSRPKHRLWLAVISFLLWCYLAVYTVLSAPGSAGAASLIVPTGFQWWVILRIRFEE